jgi:hypothetical protein
VLQREELCEALRDVHQHQPGSPLSKLWQIMGQMYVGRFVVHMQSAMKATLHQGNTKLSVKKARAGSTEDCYAFVPYEFPQGGAELNVMEVYRIAVLRWHSDDVEEALEPMYDHEGAHVDDEEAVNAHLGMMHRIQCLGRSVFQGKFT